MSRAENWTQANIAWLAGLIEGEGCLTWDGNRPKIQLGMTDEDVVRKAQRIAGVGGVSGPYTPSKAHRKLYWVWRVTSGLEAYAVIAAILPFMGERRGARCTELMVRFAQLPPRQSLLCGTTSRYKNRGCRCSLCVQAMRDAQKLSRARLKSIVPNDIRNLPNLGGI